MAHEPQGSGKVRLDKWLWAARFYKTRGLSADEIDKGRVAVNGAAAKPAREVRVGDRIELRIGPVTRTVDVRALSGVRGPASAAALLYEETAESVSLRLAVAERRRLAPEPAETIAQGRPSKRDRRDLDAMRRPAGNWNDRWSASLDRSED
ncbi:RNA-binding S4 domain-containing protein [Hydrogenophaga sp. RWCD_12]|uniref:RNA-binding S4 domain-containing protein n=1 Tax=Hydrogenophaga sp. RWCD_12 TaxID=3391190 RepID=UPI003984C00C